MKTENDTAYLDGEDLMNFIGNGMAIQVPNGVSIIRIEQVAALAVSMGVDHAMQLKKERDPRSLKLLEDVQKACDSLNS